MKANIVITLDGKVSAITQEGTFEGGSEQINKLLAKLQAVGTEIALDGPIEQHRHDDPGQVHTHSHVHQ